MYIYKVENPYRCALQIYGEYKGQAWYIYACTAIVVADIGTAVAWQRWICYTRALL